MATIAALIFCGVTFFLAAEFARGLRERQPIAVYSLIGAAVGFVGVVVALTHQLPAPGFQRFIGMAIAGLVGVACFWFTKEHVDRQRPVAGALSGILGLTQFALLFILWFGPAELPRHGEGGVSGPLSVAEQMTRLTERKVGLQTRLDREIPAFRGELKIQAADARGALQQARGDTKVQLSDELREIARLLLALENQEAETAQLLVRIGSEQRRLERLRRSATTFADDAQLAEDLDRIWSNAGTLLSRSVRDNLSGGAIEDARIDEKLAELMR